MTMSAADPDKFLIVLPREGRISADRYWLARMVNFSKPAGEIVGFKFRTVDEQDIRPGFSGVMIDPMNPEGAVWLKGSS